MATQPGDVGALFESRDPVERFPQRLSSGVGAVALEDDDQSRLQRRRNLRDLVWTLAMTGTSWRKC
ncbi:hypothetical protein [Candidatus Amarobacter glycogenicus]|uniref:hypothetical protein n=1 Tax=Candidatus Amarobacter glycogenicus TaxID=3140699 RepID=UPI002A0B9988|nr:hypothetical protein [Dehalococcoidia bacterium]